MPEAEVWTLYPALGVLFLMLLGIGLGARAMWREYQAWMEKQDVKRSDERDKQRSWEESQDRLRDDRWQGFIATMKADQARESEADRKTITNLADVIEGMRKAVEQLTFTLKNHILEDDARFDVLLTPEQKSAIEDVKTQPRKKPQ